MDVAFLPGPPVFWPVCPASRRNISRDAINLSSFFSMAGYGLYEITNLERSKNRKYHCSVVRNVLIKVYNRLLDAASNLKYNNEEIGQ